MMITPGVKAGIFQQKFISNGQVRQPLYCARLTEIITKPCTNHILIQEEWKLLDFKIPHPKGTISNKVFKTTADLDGNEVKSHNLEGGIFNLPNPGCLG